MRPCLLPAMAIASNCALCREATARLSFPPRIVLQMERPDLSQALALAFCPSSFFTGLRGLQGIALGGGCWVLIGLSSGLLSRRPLSLLVGQFGQTAQTPHNLAASQRSRLFCTLGYPPLFRLHASPVSSMSGTNSVRRWDYASNQRRRQRIQSTQYAPCYLITQYSTQE